MSLTLRDGCAFPSDVGILFSEYTQMLIDGDPSFQAYLDIQNYDGELSHLEQKYGYPSGRLYLADWDGKLAGCIGLRRLDGIRCAKCFYPPYMPPEKTIQFSSRARTPRTLRGFFASNKKTDSQSAVSFFIPQVPKYVPFRCLKSSRYVRR